MKREIKKTIVLALMLISLLISSCKKEESQIDVEPGIIQGTINPNEGKYFFNTQSKTLYEKQGNSWKALTYIPIQTGKSLHSGELFPDTRIGNDGDGYVQTSSPTQVYFKSNGKWNRIYPKSQNIKFSDVNFKKALLGVFDTNQDGEISIEEAQVSTATTINVSNKQIRSIDGIEYFIHLQTLDISKNFIAGDFDAKSLTKLKIIKATNNNFTKIDLSKSPLLVSSTIVSDNPNLTIIKVATDKLANQFNRIEKTTKYSHSDEITEEVISFVDANFKAYVLSDGMGVDTNKDGQITIIEANAYKGEITIINVKGTSKKIESLEDLKYFKNINFLQVSNAGVNSKVVIKDFLNLERIVLANNNFSEIELDNLPKLTDLNLNGNQLTSFMTNDIPTLKKLELNGNPLNRLEINNLRNITELSLVNIRIKGRIDISNLSKLSKTNIKCSNCGNSEITSIKVASSVLADKFNNFEKTNVYIADGYTPPSISQVIVNDNNLKNTLLRAIRESRKPGAQLETTITTENAKWVEGTLLVANNVNDIKGLEAFVNITGLNFSANVNTLDISNFSRLKTLNIGGIVLTTVNTGNISTLTSVTITAKNLEKLDLKNNENLNIVTVAKGLNMQCISVHNQSLVDMFENQNEYYDNTQHLNVRLNIFRTTLCD